jgi:hypothetical protein
MKEMGKEVEDVKEILRSVERKKKEMKKKLDK